MPQQEPEEPTPAERRATELASTRATLRAYLEDKLRAEDWHGVMDAAADLREVDAEARALAFGAPLGGRAPAIQRVEIVVTSDVSPTRIARAVEASLRGSRPPRGAA